MTAKIAHLSSRALIAVMGPDWRSFLQGLITQDVGTLKPGEMRYGALLTPQGRLLNDLFVSGDDEGAVLDVAAEARDGLIAKLNLYRLRAKVQIAALEAQVVAAWGDEPAVLAGGWRADPRLPDLGWRGHADHAPETSNEEAYLAHRLRLGAPDPIRDAVENDYPIELNFDLLHGIDFKKGCFVGQETTSRMHRRGVVKTRLAPVSFEGPPLPFGAPILQGERRAGEMRSGADGRALALLRIDRADGALTCEGWPITLELPAWLGPVFAAVAHEPQQS